MSIGSQTLVLATAIVVVAASGVALTRSGRPFSAVALNVHKLVDLGVLVGVGTIVVRDSRVAPLSQVALTAVALVAGVQLLVLVTGGIVAALTSPPRWVTWAHRLVSWVALAVTAWWAVLFLG